MPTDPGELSRHRIEAVTVRKLRTRWPRLLGRNARHAEHGYGWECLVYQIDTDQGATGWGLAKNPPLPPTPDVQGRRLSDLFDPAVGVIAPDAMPLDVALHDVGGVVLDQAVYQMLGSRGQTTVPCYSAMGYMHDITPAYHPGGVEMVVRHCGDDYELGYRAFKLKIGRGFRWMERRDGLRRDIEVTRAVREGFPDCLLIVDGNDGFDCDEFLRYFEAVSDCKLFSIEEPFRENRDGLLRLREAIAAQCPSTTVTDGETHPDIELLLQLGAEGLVDILNLDIMGFGFTPWREVAPRALEAGMLLTPHTFALRLKTFYGAHMVAGVGGVSPLEGVIDETEGVDTSAYRFEEGILHVPRKPGFGLPLIWGREYHADGCDDFGRKLMM